MGKNQSQDLGFIEGIKGELITLIAGLISFTLLAEKAFNEIESFFSMNEVNAMEAFAILYFFMPVVFILFWLAFINSKKGLKLYYWQQHPDIVRPPLLRFVIIALSGLIILLTILFVVAVCWWDGEWWLHLIIGSISGMLVLIYASQILKRNRKAKIDSNGQPVPGSEENNTLFYQADRQFWTVLIALTILFLAHFVTLYCPSDDTTDGLLHKQLNNSIDLSGNARQKLIAYRDSTEKLFNEYPAYLRDSASFKSLLNEIKKDDKEFVVKKELTNDSVLLSMQTRYDIATKKLDTVEKYIDALIKEQKRDKLKIYSIKKIYNKEDKNLMRTLNAEINSLGKTTEKLKGYEKQYKLYKEQITSTLFSIIKHAQGKLTEGYKRTSKTWLNIARAKGLLIFNLIILALLCIWYDAYTLQLINKQLKLNSGATKKEVSKIYYSEVNISRMSVYIIFLLIIPFFKPVEERDIGIDKPYISFTTNNAVEPVTPQQAMEGPTSSNELLSETARKIDTVYNKTEVIKTALRKMSQYQKDKLKKELQKPNRPYDTLYVK
jgi:hypothetical protein